MLTKEGLRAEFAKEHYQVPLFAAEGFARRRCAGCGRHFWSADPERARCGDSGCEAYGFLGKPVTKRKYGYVEMWKEFAKFFAKHGHTEIARYPVVDRWRPDLYFTIASIQDFQRIDAGQMSFEYPADPLIVPQVCLRFNDIPNVGVTGRHHTSFIMGGQHSFGKYFKEQCLELNFGFLHKVLGIPKEKLTYVEDVWAMPDFSAFGPSIETTSLGLELVNHVFMQFTKAGAGLPQSSRGYAELPVKVNDTGWGHERLVWFSNGTQMGYDSVFPAVVSWLRKATGVKPDELFDRYAELAGGLDFEERHASAIRARIAKELGVEGAAFQRSVAPMQAIYAIADHLKTLLFAVADGGIPSNVGGGYNLRVLLRRVFAFCEEHRFSFDVMKVAELHAKELTLFPELRAGLPTLGEVVAVERERYARAVERGRGLVVRAIERGTIAKELETLYVSHGVTPELVQQLAEGQGARVDIPGDFYAKLAAKHAAGRKEEDGKEQAVAVHGLPQTVLAYYDTPYERAFTAAVVAKRGPWLVLERTLFYPEGGGQPADRGGITLAGKPYRVVDVQKVGGVVLHRIEGAFAAREGEEASGEIDWDWRARLMKAHTATHLLAGAARHVIGSHVWQAGAQKGYATSRLDLTHFRAFSAEEVRRIEGYANAIVRKGAAVDARFLPRGEAEQRYGFVLYQGGASPGKLVRVVKVGGVDVECCGGTHLRDAKEIGQIKIVRSERVQDGVNRLEYAVAEAAEGWAAEREALAKRVAAALGPGVRPVAGELEAAALSLGIAVDQLEGQVLKFTADIDRLALRLGEKAAGFQGSLAGAVGQVFAEWKRLSKEAERRFAAGAKERAEELAQQAKGNRVSALVKGGRKELVDLADALIRAHPELTVVLANADGDVVCMSWREHAGALAKRLCAQAGGKGGGSERVGQGRGEPGKLRELLH